MVVSVKKLMHSGKSGCIWAKLVAFDQEWLYSGKSGCIPSKWLYSGKYGCIWANMFYSAKWLNSGRVVLFGQSGCI